MNDYNSVEKFKELCGYEIDGFWYPRVTKIVEIKAKPALYHFYANMANFAAGEKVKKQSAEEGTMIHEAVEAILTGGKPEIDPSITPSIIAFAEFIEKKNIQVDRDFVEHRLVNFEHRYAGTLDAIAMIDGKLGILDIKTSQEIYRDYNLQTSAYIAAMRDIVKKIETRWILRIDQAKACLTCGASLRTKGGKEKIRTAKYRGASCPEGQHEWSETRGIIELKEFPYWKEDFDAFLGAKKLWEWENDGWLRKVGYLK